ncbi:ribonuclease H family protein [Gulosibacter hominis]|uniref:ribonuclease H family protein n=1 Tax=Gulosibacter hominis TaxID=2770504 RepID=UPI001918C38A|nr:ribonuclease H [Gulosibacter hominis]
MEIVAAADGSSLGNPGPAGWAWVTAEGDWRAGGWPRGTNNQGELMAVLDLLRATEKLDASLRILCDSQYVINSVTKWMPGWKRRGWKKSDGKPVQNRDLLEQIDAALAGREVSFEWVRGHSGHDLNERADDYARAVATAYHRGVEPETGPGLGKGRGAGGAGTSRAGAADADGAAGVGGAGRAAGAESAVSADADVAGGVVRSASADSDSAGGAARSASARSERAGSEGAARTVAGGEGASLDAALFDLDDESFAADTSAAAVAELRRLEADSAGREHPDFERVGPVIAGDPELVRVWLLGSGVAVVRSQISGRERTSVWQLTDGGDFQRWLLRLRHQS